MLYSNEKFTKVDIFACLHGYIIPATLVEWRAMVISAVRKFSTGFRLKPIWLNAKAALFYSVRVASTANECTVDSLRIGKITTDFDLRLYRLTLLTDTIFLTIHIDGYEGWGFIFKTYPVGIFMSTEVPLLCCKIFQKANEAAAYMHEKDSLSQKHPYGIILNWTDSLLSGSIDDNKMRVCNFTTIETHDLSIGPGG